VGIPENVATVLTFPERVTDHNIEALRRAVCNGAPRRAWACLWKAEPVLVEGCALNAGVSIACGGAGVQPRAEGSAKIRLLNKPHAPGGAQKDAAMRLQRHAGGRAGVAAWPGANFLEYARGGGRFSLKWGDRRRLAAELKARPTRAAMMRGLL